MKKQLSAFFLLCLAGSLLMAQTTLHLYPDYDAAIGSHTGFGTANNNYGTAIQNSAFCIPGTNTGENLNRALIHFDLSQIAPGTQILAATLDLYALGPSGTLNGHTGIANSAFVKPVTSAWQEMSVTWNTQPTYGTLNQASLPVSTSSTQDYLGINVTAMVQSMINNPTSNNGFGLMLQNEQVTNALTFASSDHPDSLLHPRLHITFCQDVVVMTPAEDAAIGTHDGLGTANNNYGTAPQFAAYCITAANGTPNGNINRALARFDLSSIPTNAIVTSASLGLYARGPSGTLNGHTGPANGSFIEQVTQPWSSTTVTWNNQPTTTNTNAATLTQSTNSLQDYLAIDVTAIVQGMVANPSTNYGFMLRLINEVENNALVFQSMDCGDSTKFPKLTVHIQCGEGTAITPAIAAQIPAQLFPNPANDQLHLRIDLPEPASMQAQLFDLSGRALRELDLGHLGTGHQTIDLSDLTSTTPAGMYIVRLTIDEQHLDRKLILN